jgi:Tfp pilus assembly protein PilO
MFEQYSYKKKFMALVLIFVMLSITAYKRSFSTLFQTISEYKVLSSKTDELNKKANNANGLIKDVAYLDKIMGKEGTTKEMIQQGIVSFASENHNGISIHDVQPIHVFSDENYTTITNQLDITGSANQLLKLSYDFEKIFDLSRITSMNFYTIKNNNKSEVLHLKMIFQNYEIAQKMNQETE